MLRFAVVVSARVGYAGRFVEEFVQRKSRQAELVAVILCNYQLPADRRRVLRQRKLRKALRIGLLGTLNGLRMRKWYGAMLNSRGAFPDLVAVGESAGIPVIQIPNFTSAAAKDQIRSLGLDLAVSMGNGYIPKSFFTIPRLGMINIHHEYLPDYKGAQTVLWQLHNGSDVSGFTIHEINESIDAGRILTRSTVPLQLRPTLRETVIETSLAVNLSSIDRLTEVLEDFEGFRKHGTENSGGNSYTTPSSRAMLRIYWNHWKLRRRAGLASKGSHPS